MWSLLTDLDVAGVIDEVVGARRSDAGASVGTYLALAALGRLVAPRSKKAFADWWATTAGTGSPGSARRCWTTASSGMPCTPWMPMRCRRSRPGSRPG